MSLTIQMLGTGSAFAKHYYNNNALLDSGEGKLLIDCGTTASLALHQMGVPLPDIGAILITHIHADHVGGLEEFGFQMNILHRRKPLLYIAEPLIHPLWEHTLKGGMSQQGMIDKLEDVFEVNVITPGVPTTLVSGIQVELIPTRHIPGKNSYSIFINDHLFIVQIWFLTLICFIIWCMNEDVGVFCTRFNYKALEKSIRRWTSC